MKWLIAICISARSVCNNNPVCQACNFTPGARVNINVMIEANVAVTLSRVIFKPSLKAELWVRLNEVFDNVFFFSTFQELQDELQCVLHRPGVSLAYG